MKIFFKFLLLVALYFSAEKLIRTQTNGFRLEKIQSDFSSRPEWEIQNSKPLPDVLNQRFYFLDSGVQCYAFESEDHTTVLKVFKHYHLWPSSKILRALPLPNSLRKRCDATISKREARIDKIFQGAKIACEDLSENTAVFYVNLNPTNQTLPPVEIYDKIGVRYTFDLNTTPFLLQRKAELLLPYLDKHSDQAVEIIDAYFDCVLSRIKKGYTNEDSRINRNIGISKGQVIEIDIGALVKNSPTSTDFYQKREVFYEICQFKEWASKNRPELNDYLDQKLKQVIRA
ncbi:MAG: hypothetical protein K1000chlam2_00486 [Chlamydiae bacterium]|nr:hypothetical protein [Chlamydiota bacterium]